MLAHVLGLPRVARLARDLGGGDGQLAPAVGDLDQELVAVAPPDDASRVARPARAVRLCKNDELHAGRLLAAADALREAIEPRDADAAVVADAIAAAAHLQHTLARSRRAQLATHRANCRPSPAAAGLCLFCVSFAVAHPLAAEHDNAVHQLQRQLRRLNSEQPLPVRTGRSAKARATRPNRPLMARSRGACAAARPGIMSVANNYTKQDGKCKKRENSAKCRRKAPGGAMRRKGKSSTANDADG